MRKINLVILISILTFTWSCNQLNEDKLKFIGATCTNPQIEFEKIGERRSSQGVDFDLITVYKIPQSKHEMFLNHLTTRLDSLNSCGYWVMREDYAIYKPSRLSIENGHYYKMEYSYDLNILIVREFQM